MKKLFLIAPVLFILIAGAACRKEGATTDDPNSITGSWQFIDARGGFTGRDVIKANGKIVYTFNTDSTYKYTRNDTLKSSGNFHIRLQKSIFSAAARQFLILGNTSSALNQVVSIHNDTLSLSDNHVEGYGYTYVRIK